MKTRVRKWGNSLALRIPKAIALEAHLGPDTVVEVTSVDGKVMVVPIAVPSPTLESLLAGVTDDNLHGEVDTGPATGVEAW